MTADGDTARGGSAKSAPGRPRDGRIDAAIITATRELVLETGYPALTLSAIAARAGTTTAALYRRWSSKAQLVHEAVLEAEVIPAFELPDGAGGAASSAGGADAAVGDPQADIRALVETVRVLFDRPEVRVALPGLIADTVADPDLHARMIARLAGNLPAFESRFGRARRSDDHLPVLAEVVAGAAIFRLLVSPDAALDDEWVEELTALITGRWQAGG
ncbi:TetR-like C-terminal domain-containing protein [Dietzia sp. 111N12-1]|uniref:TetR-like C-terminal domain-containing protein n=1 Tax=Dietzia sp. 111N12-1 TaxID=1785156 RepID=UPI000804E7A3|nr:TetR-like C-terminal domain-containing protein [Dietzia sp. 111N12-1]OAV77807.1 TetR family transcriptional regulator [Dietzia sp. 111N12-1]